MIDRGQLELAQITDRLLQSRNRPKRQWLIERIGHIWSYPSSSCGILPLGVSHQVHADPTEESIDAVVSFVSDPHVNVRIAVAFAIRKHSVPVERASRALATLLTDDHPVVRVNAAYGVLIPPRIHSVSIDTIEAALADPTYMVPWMVASALHDSDLADRAWEALRGSIPRTPLYFSVWLDYCALYQNHFAADTALQAEVAERLAAMDADDSNAKSCRESYDGLLRPEGKK